MKGQVLILVVVWPLLAGVLTSLLPNRPKLLFVWSLINLLAVNLLGVLLIKQVLTGGELSYHLSGWAPPLGIEYRATTFSSLLSWLVSLVAIGGILASRGTWESQLGHSLPYFLSLWLLLVASYQGICLSNDAFNLYVMLEISSLATYGLIAFGGGRAYLATFHYVIMGTIGASFYLLGIGYLYIKTGTLNIDDLQQILGGMEFTRSLVIALAFLVTGMLLKMAVFPLHFWLPNAYTYAPATATVLIAPLSTKLAVFMLFRIMTDIFGGRLFAVRPTWSLAVVILATVGILFGTGLALAQRDLKKTFACLIVAEAGYMLGGLWLPNERGTHGALYHLLNDAVSTLVLFMVVIAVRNSCGGRSLGDLKGLFQRSPLTGAALVLVGFNLIGLPPTSGFFSKALLLSSAIEAGHWEFVAALLFASLGNLAVFFRMYESAFFHPSEESRPAAAGQYSGGLALAAGSLLIALGLGSQEIIQTFIVPVVRS